jgi:PAS domain S-box-containing protein
MESGGERASLMDDRESRKGVKHDANTYNHEDIPQSAEEPGFYTVLDQLPEGILFVEAHTGKVCYANPAAATLLGQDLASLVGSPLTHEAWRTPPRASSLGSQAEFPWNFALIDAMWGKTVTNQEIVIKRPDGSEVVVLGSAAPLRAEHGLITQAVLAFQDISALKWLEQQKNEFFAVANHELRTPLTSILGFAELLRMRANLGEVDAMTRDAIASIVHECEHLQRLLADLLAVSHLEHGRLEVKRSYVDLLGPLRQMVTRSRQQANQHRLHFIQSELPPEGRLPGWFDLLRIEQVLNNLLSNAVKYSPVGREIEVGVRCRHDRRGKALEVILWVKDQGRGIAVSDLPHIFDSFYRGTSFQRSSISGFGIGLYLSRQIVQAHGGRIWVESHPEQGSTFFVALPLEEEETKAI